MKQKLMSFGLKGVLALIVSLTLVVAACSSPASPPSGTSSGKPVQLKVTAQNFAFDTKTITVPAGAAVTITFVNNDASAVHNIAIYNDSTAATSIFKGENITGPKTTTYQFTAPSKSGTYFFRCDAHPTIMTGSFVVE